MLRLAAVGIALLTVTAAAAAGPRPLLTTHLRIEAFAQDGSRIVWMSGGCYTVRIRSLAARRTAVVGNADATTCDVVLPPLLALAGRRALWVDASAGNNIYAEVTTGSARKRNDVLEEVVGASGGSDGDYVTDVAGDGPTLVYAVISMSFLDTCIDPGEPCAYFVTGGRVMRVVGDRARKIPGLPPALDVAASGPRIALVVAAPDAPGGAAIGSGEVQVRAAATGALVSHVSVDGEPSEVALGPSVLAVATKTGSRSHAIECFRADTGAPLARVDVPGAATDLSVSGRRVLFHVGRAIRVFDAVSGQSRLVAVARPTLVSASIEGGRVAWAEARRRGSRIVAAAAG